MLRAYCLNILLENRALKRAVGIGIDASSKVTGRKGGSEDFYALEVREWTAELENEAKELKNAFGLMQPGNKGAFVTSVDEFPKVKGDRAVAIYLPSAVIKPDRDWPGMWRVHLTNGQITDMANLTRAKEAAKLLSRG